MSAGNGTPTYEAVDPVHSLAAIADRLIREATVASLATIERNGGHPYASLVEVATLPDSRPVMLLSALARHSRNLEADSRVALLVDKREHPGASLATARATVMGTARQDPDPASLRRFLNRHPGADAYAGLGDFSLWRIDPTAVHVVAGFGRIGEIAWPLCGDATPGQSCVLAADDEAEIVRRLGALLPAKIRELGLTERIPEVRFAGADRDGIDLLIASGERREAIRMTYASRAHGVEDAVAMACDLIYRWIHSISGTSAGRQRKKAKPNARSGG